MRNIRKTKWQLSASTRTALALVAMFLAAAPLRPVAAQETAPAAAAATPVAVQSPAAGQSPADRARVILDRHCARCHQSSRIESHGLASLPQPVPAMEDLLRDGVLLKAGFPDASRLYTVMISGHVPQQAYDTANPGPTPDEIDELRGWIESLAPATPTACPERRQIGLADEGRALEKLRAPGGEALKGIRFISLSADHNACASAEAMVSRRRAAIELMTALRTTLVTIDLPLAGDDVPVLAVRLGDLGWDVSQWDALAADAAAPKLTDAASVAAFGTASPLLSVRDLAAAAQRSAKFPGLSSLSPEAAQFTREGQASVDLGRAAADVGRPPAALFEQLATVQGKFEGLALALRQGSLSAAGWRELRPVVTAGAATTLAYMEASSATAAPGRLEVSLWTDKLSYLRQDLVVLTAQANRDCNLTVINVDTSGEATVLFPSDSDPDNAVKAGSKVRIPSDIEPYQLRASEAGTETFIAVCTLNRKRMLGIDQDFERQRFSVLGNWRAFLKTAATRESLIGRRDTPRQRRARKAATAAAATATQPEQEARAAIYVRIE